jgi:hypothetical protein
MVAARAKTAETVYTTAKITNAWRKRIAQLAPSLTLDIKYAVMRHVKPARILLIFARNALMDTSKSGVYQVIKLALSVSVTATMANTVETVNTTTAKITNACPSARLAASLTRMKCAVLSNAQPAQVLLTPAQNALLDTTRSPLISFVKQRLAPNVPPRTTVPLVRMTNHAPLARSTTSVTKTTTAFHARVKVIMLMHANDVTESTSKMRMATAESAALKYLAAPSAPTLKLAPNALLATTTHP